jgi:putative nucleotidyltransferase with HDIG domain
MPPSLAPAQEPAPAPGARRRSERGGSQRLLNAFTAVERLPALGQSRRRATLALARGGALARNELIAIVERDVAMCSTLLRTAASEAGSRRRTVTSAAAAVDMLGEVRVRELVADLDEYAPFDPHPVLGHDLERLRLHSVQVRQIAAVLAGAAGHPDPHALASAALLHDIGKLVLAFAYAGYPQRVHGSADTPPARLEAERRLLGLDHAVVGGVLVRRWGLPDAVADMVSQHHTDSPSAALLRLADTLAHHCHGPEIDRDALAAHAAAAGFDLPRLESLVYEFGAGETSARLQPSPECPLSRKERAVIAQLATGQSYKEIAGAMGLSISTVRTHLHNTYRKLGVVDRAQAVLQAVALGWIEAPTLTAASVLEPAA